MYSIGRALSYIFLTLLIARLTTTAAQASHLVSALRIPRIPVVRVDLLLNLQAATECVFRARCERQHIAGHLTFLMRSQQGLQIAGMQTRMYLVDSPPSNLVNKHQTPKAMQTKPRCLLSNHDFDEDCWMQCSP